MGSLEKIDDNNFVIKMKCGQIKDRYRRQDFNHLGYSWKLKYQMQSHAHLVLKCEGPDDDLWCIDANIRIIVMKKSPKISTIARFNRSNSEAEICIEKRAELLGREAFYHCDIEIHVKINSITGIQRKSAVDFDNKTDPLSDVALIVERKKLFVNKAVLATFSPVFRAMFFTGFKESTDKEVVIKDVKYDDFKQFLQHIHSPTLIINKENIEALLILADRYDVGIVMEKCEKYLETTDEITVVKKLSLAETYTLSDVHKKYMDSLDTKEKVKKISEKGSFLGPMTLRALLKKSLSFDDNDNC